MGQGAFCTVYQAKDHLAGELIAVKVIKRKTMTASNVELLKKEAELLEGIKHENIVKFKHVSFFHT